MGTVIRRGSRPLRAVLAFGLLAVLAAGCDIFRPASPQVGGVVSTLLPNYAAPESCLYYMRVGIERKDNVGQAAYLGALADTTADGQAFHAFFDPVVLNAYVQGGGTAPGDWDLRHETQFVSVFVRSYSDPYLMEWLENEKIPISNDILSDTQAIMQRRYRVWAVRQATGEALLIADGYARLTFARISASRWALVLWEEDPAITKQLTDKNPKTFGYLRLNAGAGG